MEEQLRHQIKISKIKEMKNPVIIMNNLDFEYFKDEVNFNTLNANNNPKYENIPIRKSIHINRGEIFIYDDIYNRIK